MARAAEALKRTCYAGLAPVTAEQYIQGMRAQQAHRWTPSREDVKAVLDDIILAPEVADRVARALHSGDTTILYGPSGNGKTSILERLARGLDGAVFIPYAIYAYGHVIRVFDEAIHEPIERPSDVRAYNGDPPLDRRWVLVRRPAVVVGPEIGPESLEPAYDQQVQFYQAPPHVKAQGGLLAVDDLGRHKADPRQTLGRWLISRERGSDSLSLTTGEKFTIPFNLQLVLATNMPMDELADDPLLRRIRYKVEIPNPGPQELAKLVRWVCRQRNVQAAEGAIQRLVDRLCYEPGRTPAAARARDLVEVVVERASCDDVRAILDEESVERALEVMPS